MLDPKAIALELLLELTERDKQVKIGASNASNPCSRCLGDDLIGVERPRGRYRMGAIVGTAVHMLLEERVREIHPPWGAERKVIIGELDGYGEVKSTTDLYVPEEFAAVDWKTTTKTKLVHLKRALEDEPSPYDLSKVLDARFKTTGYKAQLHLYGRGLVRAGLPVKQIGIGFVCRDASTEDDVWGWSAPFDAEYAEVVWSRVERLWAWVRDGGDVRTLPSHPNCYFCNVDREDI